MKINSTATTTGFDEITFSLGHSDYFTDPLALTTTTARINRDCTRVFFFTIVKRVEKRPCSRDQTKNRLNVFTERLKRDRVIF